MIITKSLLPGTHINADGIDFLRLSNGDVAAKSSDNIVLSASSKTAIENITLIENGLTVSFWKVNGRYYSPRFDSRLKRLFNVTRFGSIFKFCKGMCYPLTECIGIEYETDSGVGILSIAAKKTISILISDKIGYDKIYFEDGAFYATSKKDKDMYHILNAQGKVIFKSNCEYRKVNGYKIFYYGNKITTISTLELGHISEDLECVLLPYNKKEKKDLTMPEEIKSIVVKGACAKRALIRVKCESNVYYYSCDAKFLFTTSGNDKMYLQITDGTFWIHEYKDGKCVRLIKTHLDFSFCEINSTSEIFEINSISNDISYYGTGENNIYATYSNGKSDFIKMAEDVPECDYFKNYGYICDNKSDEETTPQYFLIGFKNEKPYWCIAFNTSPKFEVLYEGVIDKVSRGFTNNFFICKIKEHIFGVDISDNFVKFAAVGTSLKKMTVVSSNGVKSKIYAIRNKSGEYQFF